MNFSVFKLNSAALLIVVLISSWGCSSLQEFTQVKHTEEFSALPEQIYLQPKKNYYTASRVMVFTFDAPVNYSSVGAKAADMLFMKLVKSKMFYAVTYNPEIINQNLEAQLQIAKKEGFDFIITGKILNYLSGTRYQESRVDEEILVYNVKTKEVLWHASAVEVGKPVPERDYYIFQSEGKQSPSATLLLSANTDKFVRMMQWTAPEFSAFTEDMQLVDKGYNHMLAQNNAKAKYYFEQALEVNPDNPYALLDLGVIFEREGRLPEAAVLYQRVIDLNSAEIVAESTRPQGLDLTLAEVAKDNLARLTTAVETFTPKE
jgi:tetratricopeptide (TPR) repeat protein